MGLFGKKEICPICGKKIKGDVLIKIQDNIPLCKECSAKVNMDADLIGAQSVEDMRAHLNYREKNLERYEKFVSTIDAKAGTSYMSVDESQKLWLCTRNRKDKNPPLFEYGEIAGFQYLEDGAPIVEEEKKSGLGGLFGGKKEPVMLHSMKVHIDLANPYTKAIDVEAVAMNDEVKTGSFAYKSNRRALDKVLEMLEGMTNHVKAGAAISEEESAPAADAEEGLDEFADEEFADAEETSEEV